MRKTLWVMARQDEALERQVQFSGLSHDRSKIKYIGVCAMLAGQGYDEIILDDIYAEADSKIIRERIMLWVLDLKCRLYSGGRIRTLS